MERNPNLKMEWPTPSGRVGRGGGRGSRLLDREKDLNRQMTLRKSGVGPFNKYFDVRRQNKKKYEQ